MRRRTTASVFIAALVLALQAVGAQGPRTPSARLVSAPATQLPGDVDSSNPFIWDLVDGALKLFVMTSWGGVPVQSSGPAIDQLRAGAPVAFASHPGHGVWIESILSDDAGTWYAYYHHERPADDCGRPERQLPRIGSLRSPDQGRTWEDLGIVLDAPDGSAMCASGNRFVLGGVGDVSAVLDANKQDVYLFFSQYSGGADRQGVAVARLAWSDRDAPSGKAAVFNDGAWLPATRSDADGSTSWSYPAGTPLEKATRPFHDRDQTADVYWGASVHWNTYLEQYVMVLNRAKDESFGTELRHRRHLRVVRGVVVGPAAMDDPAQTHERRRMVPAGRRTRARHRNGSRGRPASQIFSDRKIQPDDRVRTLTLPHTGKYGQTWRSTRY
jgi:hypothetical protein